MFSLTTSVVTLALMVILFIVTKQRVRHNLTHFKIKNDQPTPTPLQAWTLAVVARYLMEKELPVNAFRPPEYRRVATLKPLPAKQWGVETQAQLLNVIYDLHNVGHREHFAQMTGRPMADFLAWDLMRAVLVASAGLNLDLISPAEFETVLLVIGPELQAGFADWPQAAASYELGVKAWIDRIDNPAAAENIHRAAQTLLNDPASPWKTTPWRTPITKTAV